MLRITTIVLLLTVAQAHAQGDAWTEFVTNAGERHGDLGRRAASFLAEHRPPGDDDVDLELLMENLDYALEARETFPWAKSLSEEMFFNDVLPYAVLDETRERWRAEFFEMGREIVKDCTTATEAAQALNRELFNVINVHYNTGRKAPNQSPSESIEQGRATCTGLSIILADACRAVGVPARAAGVASWKDRNGNHTWVEIWDGAWYFTGADEYNGDGLNRTWFNGAAAQAVAGDPRHAVWATSWADTGASFPMVWNPQSRDVPGVDVTHRYMKRDPGSSVWVTRHLRLWKEEGGNRVVGDVRVLDPDDAEVAAVSTKAAPADRNDMPSIEVLPGVAYTLEVTFGGATRHAMLDAAGENETVDLVWSDLAIDRHAAEAILEDRWTARAFEIARERADEVESEAFEHGDHTMKILERTYGDAADGEKSLWISMHGGGGAPPEVNDQQWRNQIRLYTLDEGIYIAPRAPTDTWNLWHQGHIDTLFDRMIETYVATRGVDPNRVYLLGYSAGGDGVYQLAPRMADRFAAASMMAGHPNETKPDGLRNLPFAIFMGGKDGAYKRNEIAESWGKQLEALAGGDEGGYPHRVTIYPEHGHWMQGEDAEGLPWMAEHTRNPWPKRVVWHQDDVTHTRFYWLATKEPVARRTIKATVDGQTITIEPGDATSLTLRLRDELVDLDKPVRVVVGDDEVFRGRVARTQKAIETSLSERADPASAATALLELSW